MEDYILSPDAETREKESFKTFITSGTESFFDSVSVDEIEDYIPILVEKLSKFEGEYEIEVK